jgi:hypothetical protein
MKLIWDFPANHRASSLSTKQDFVTTAAPGITGEASHLRVLNIR